jgi:hypothetical protein
MNVLKRKKIVTSGLGIGLVVLLALCLGLFIDWETPPFEIRKVYSLPLGENELATVRFVAATDLTGDGRKEVLMSYDVASFIKQQVGGVITHAIMYKEARVLILSSDPADSFQKLWEHDSGLTRQTAAVGDFNGDGKPDVVVGGFKVENVNESPPSMISMVEVLLQREDGSFGTVFTSNIPEFLGPGSIVADDFDGDGRADFVVGGLAMENESPYHAHLFRNENGENFTVAPIALREKITMMDMWKADINRDGSPDLITCVIDRYNKTYLMILLLNDGRGEFEFREFDIFADMGVIDTMVVGDFTGDGYPDVTYTAGGRAYLLRNDQGGFAEPEPTDIQGEGIFMGMMSADFNNDNTPDVLLLEEVVEFREDLKKFEVSTIGHLLLVEEKVGGELSFTRGRAHRFLEGRISSEHAVAAADINDDGWVDLILVCEGGGVYLSLNRPRE